MRPRRAQIGDRVRIVSDRSDGTLPQEYVGKEGTMVSSNPKFPGTMRMRNVRFDDGDVYQFWPEEMEVVE